MLRPFVVALPLGNNRVLTFAMPSLSYGMIIQNNVFLSITQVSLMLRLFIVASPFLPCDVSNVGI